ncbi:hypothetical protein BDW22DRAFT_17919 [Trametopsis cervina]|nr:hypothetical protein BDW22DRAFT_17919 [Trametopsis cervina]
MSESLLSTDSAFFEHRPRLPLELVHLILHNLSVTDDKPTLSTCTLVHTSWSTFARRLLFQVVRLDVLTMPQRAHEDHDHIDIPDFGAFISFMHSNPVLAASVREFEVRGVLGEGWDPRSVSQMPVEIYGAGLDTFDELHWVWDEYSTQKPSGCQWTKLPWSMLSTLVSVSPHRLFPRLLSVTLDSMFVEFSSIAANAILGEQTVPLDKLILRRVGTTANTNRVLLEFINVFNPIHLTLDALPFKFFDSTVPAPPVPGSGPTTPSIFGPKRTTSLELFGDPDASFIMDVLRVSPLAQNLTKLQLHINDASEVASCTNLLKKIGRGLQELSVDLRPVCYVSKPEVHMERTSLVSSRRIYTMVKNTNLVVQMQMEHTSHS